MFYNRSACHDAELALHAAGRLHARGAKNVCIRLPDGGCVFSGKWKTARFSPVPVDVVDTTGAGDAFVGALAAGLIKQRSTLDAVRLAMAASHLTVACYGAKPAGLMRDEVDRLAWRFNMNTTIAPVGR